tara:strand:+ start:119129 stop:119563 length:435 start_codon:yes stop_codon:yes gene_type:complete
MAKDVVTTECSTYYELFKDTTLVDGGSVPPINSQGSYYQAITDTGYGFWGLFEYLVTGTPNATLNGNCVAPLKPCTFPDNRSTSITGVSGTGLTVVVGFSDIGTTTPTGEIPCGQFEHMVFWGEQLGVQVTSTYLFRLGCTSCA